MGLIENRQRGFVLNHYHGEFGYEAALLTKTAVSFASFSTNNSNVITPQLTNTEDPATVMKTYGGNSLVTVPLANLTHLEWFSDDPQLDFYAVDPATGKTKRNFVRFDSHDLRKKFVGYVGACRPGGKPTDEPMSIWRVGMGQLTYSAFAFFIFVGFGIVGFFQKGPVKETGKGRGLAALFNVVGPWGFIGIGMAIIAGMMVWWYMACQKPNRRWTLQYAGKV
jgi:hypothetical protein